MKSVYDVTVSVITQLCKQQNKKTMFLSLENELQQHFMI